MENHFDVSRITGIKIIEKRKSSYKWLPEKRKTALFGLIKRNAYYSEGYYSHGHYQECYDSGCWDAHPTTRQSLLQSGYLIDSDNVVWNRPYVIVCLEYKGEVSQNFVTFEEAIQWAEELKQKSGKTFEIVKYN